MEEKLLIPSAGIIARKSASGNVLFQIQIVGLVISPIIVALGLGADRAVLDFEEEDLVE